VRVERADELDAALGELFNSEEPTLLDVRVE